MITDFYLKLYRIDPLIKRNVFKTISWRVVGSIDTAIIGWIITGDLGLGTKIGFTELFTKILLYYGHERFWQKINIGLPTRLQKNNIVKRENKPHLFKNAGRVNRTDREALNNNKSFTLWFTGLSGSGKSTLSFEIESWMFERGLRVYVLDGDNTRLGINSDLTFSEEDRKENVRRVAEICKLFNDAGTIVIASFISPFREDRKVAGDLIGLENFIEVYTDSSLEICAKRDTKGLYLLAKKGELKNFTGINSPYEAPINAHLHLRTDKFTASQCVLSVVEYLMVNGKIKEAQSPDATGLSATKVSEHRKPDIITAIVCCYLFLVGF